VPSSNRTSIWSPAMGVIAEAVGGRSTPGTIHGVATGLAR
jgi:hypothetical protein